MTIHLSRALQSLAPDDLQEPLYAVLTSELREQYLPADSIGIAGLDIDEILRDELVELGQWCGPGRAIIVCNRAAADWAKSVSVDVLTFSERQAEFCWSIALHELAHAILQPPRNTNTDCLPISKETWLQAAALDSTQVRRDLPPWHQHDGRFIRALCHLLARAEADGIQTNASIAFHESHYSVSPLADYIAALGDELVGDDRQSICEIIETPAPEAFSKLWRDDVSRWIQSCDQPRAKSLAAKYLHI